MIAASLIPEFDHEIASLRKTLERLPEDKYDWKPHDKSMSLQALAAHLAEMVGWCTMTLKTPELDFATFPYQPFRPANNGELLAFLDERTKEARAALEAASDTDMMTPWTIRNGENVFMTLPRVGMLRSMVFNHIVHHRGQLTVYMRILNVPVPALYGPSADEGAM
ncbi:MAG: DinB family protein [Bryobacter sp.]|nr:DinB family protein [Bryobacter sp.]